MNSSREPKAVKRGQKYEDDSCNLDSVKKRVICLLFDAPNISLIPRFR